jgi:uncharacterized RDD family membrane protein YckC
MSWADQTQIETPEQIDLDLDVAGPGSRFFAELLDALIRLAVILAVVIAGAFVLSATGRGHLVDANSVSGPLVLAVLILLLVLFFYGYDVYYEGYCNGQTPGKKLAGIRVVSDAGGPADVRQALIRNLVGFADFLPVFYLLGGLVSILNKRGQRLGDIAAGTVVIRVRKGELADDVETLIKTTAGEEFVFLPEQLAKCTANDLHVLHSFFSRAKQFGPQERLRLGLRLMETMLQRTGYQPSRPIAQEGRTEAFLAALYRDLKAHRQ